MRSSKATAARPAHPRGQGSRAFGAAGYPRASTHLILDDLDELPRSRERLEGRGRR